MSQERTYTIIQRDRYGEAVNTITGLDELAANTLAAVLRTGDAYQGDRPWTCDIERELTRQEAVEQLAERWLSNAEPLWMHSPMELAAALDLLAAGLNSLGDQQLGDVWLEVRLQVSPGQPDAGEADRRKTVELLAQAFGAGLEERHGFYGTVAPKGGNEHVKAFTSVKPKPVDEPVVKPVASPDVFALVEVAPEATAPAEHRPDSFWNGGDGSGGQCGASCTCGTTFDGFDSLAEASALVDKHVAAENGEPVEPQTDPAAADRPAAIPAERVDELLRDLNQKTVIDSAWWDWLAQQPEFDREATIATDNTAEVHLTDGTILRWSTETSWTRAAVA